MLQCHVTEDHNEVLPLIYRCIGSKRLPFTNNVLLHLDSHPDMLIAKDLQAQDVFSKEKLYQAISIENWIMPALFAGHICTVIWLKKPWADQITDGTYHFFVGEDIETGALRCNCKEPYFLSELLYTPKEKLINSKGVTFHVMTVPDNESQLSVLTNSLNNLLPSDASLILDIDLDYFSTQNPFISLYSQTQLDIMKTLYKYEAASTVIESCIQRKQQLEKLLEDINSIVAGQRIDPQSQRHVLLQQLVEEEQRKSVEQVDGQLLHEHGCTFDINGLPHHLSSDVEIRSYINQLASVLAALYKKPSLITIARSSDDDYCPKEQVDKIQQMVLHLLRANYSNLSVFTHYS